MSELTTASVEIKRLRAALAMGVTALTAIAYEIETDAAGYGVYTKDTMVAMRALRNIRAALEAKP